jgi:putative oxidoreductase
MLRRLDNLQPWGALLLRLALGTTMAFYGYQKLSPPGGWTHGAALGGMRHFAHYVATLHLPAWLGYVSVLTEFLGGLLLIAGLLTRFAALMIAGNMLVAYFAVNIHERYTDQQLTLVLFATACMLVFYGPGALAADYRAGIE